MRTISLTAACFVFLMTPASALPADPPPAAGMFLVATPGMQDPRFAHRVVGLVQHDPDGALGLIVNRPTDVPVSDAISGPNIDPAGRHRLYFGGPVAPGTIMYLYAGKSAGPDLRIVDGVNWGVDFHRLEALLKGLETGSLRVLFGYAGWGPGQLEFELSRGGWRVVPARAEHVFSEDARRLWQLLNGTGRGLMARDARIEPRPAL